MVKSQLQDGFYHTKATLSSSNNSQLTFRRRSAPFMFNSATFVKQIVAINNAEVTESYESEIVFKAPSFDHAKEDSVPDDLVISSKCRVVIVEGSYALLDEESCSKVAELADEK